jgi:hypothetical protein
MEMTERKRENGSTFGDVITGEIPSLNLLYENTREIRLDLNEIRETLTEVRIEVGGLKIKAGVWGALAGLIPTLVAALVTYLSLRG